MSLFQGKYSQWTTEDLKKELVVLRKQLNDPDRREFDKIDVVAKIRQIISVLRGRGL